MIKKYALVFVVLLCSFFYGFGQVTLAEWNFPSDPDDNLVDVSTPANNTKILSAIGPTGVVDYGSAGASTECALVNGWTSGNSTKYWEVEINTIGYNSLTISSAQRSSNTGPRDFKIQYKIGTGTWIDISGGGITVANDFTSGVLSSLVVPSTCDNQNSVFFRWIMTSNTSVTNGTVAGAGTSRIDDILIQGITSTSCSISDIAITNNGCNDNGSPSNTADDYYVADVIVTYSNPPATGTIDLSGTGVIVGGTTSASITSSPQTISGVHLAANNTDVEVIATFSANTVCTYTETVSGSAVASCSSGGGGCNELFISEYVEGSLNNKYIEIYNPTATAINLTGYSLVLYANGSSMPTSTEDLTGSIPAYGSIVYANSSATIYTGTTITTSVCNFNGDDAIALLNNSNYIDIIGRVGEDPGAAWTASGGYSTQNKTIRRKATVLNGISANPASGFPTLDAEWDLLDEDIVSGLGSHTSNCQVSSTPKYYRSKAVGPANWANANSWESSDDNITWVNASFIPNEDDLTITVRTGHTIVVDSPISLDETIIEGDLELQTGSQLNINDGIGDDIKIEAGGQITVRNNSGDYANIFYPDTNASIHVGTSGKIEIIGGVSGVPGNMGSLASSTSNIWDDGSIYEWNSTVGTPDGSGITYFPNANTSTIPILRISSLYTGDENIGGGFPLVVNGLLDARVNITLRSGGTKTLRNGITGSNVTITFSNTLGTLIISGPTAVLSGTLNLVLNKQLNISNGITVPTGSLVVIANSSTSNIDKVGVFDVETDAIFDIGTVCSMTNITGSVDVSGTFRTGNTNGFTGTGSSLPSVTGNVINLNPDCTVELNRNDGTPQSLTARNDFKNLTFSGSGLKTISSNFNPNGEVYITDSAILDVEENTFGNATTSLKMDNDSRFRIEGVGTKPDILGTYDLQAGVIEFYNSSTGTTENIRGTSGGNPIEYYQIEVTGDKVANSNANITLQNNGSFFIKSTGVFEINDDAIVGPLGNQTVRVENGGVFKTGDVDGFNGGIGINATSIRSDIETIILEQGSIVEYSRAGDQTLTDFFTNADVSNNYYANVVISGTGIKTMGTNDGITVNEDLNVISSELLIDDDKYIEIIGNVTVDGYLTVEKQGAFVQRGNGVAGTGTSGTFVNNGNSVVNKTTSNFNDYNYHYTYWSSPIVNANPYALFPNAADNRRYYFEAANYLDIEAESGNDNNTVFGHDDIDDNGDDWQRIEDSATPNLMDVGRGFAITATAPPSVPSPFPYNNDVVFSGAFNTGDIDVTIEYNGNNGDNDWNLIGNPYPSAINFSELYSTNSSVIDGCAFLWSHASPPLSNNNGNEDYNFNQDDYAIINLTGCTAGGSQVIPNPYIPSGQAFFVKGLSSGTLTFTNSMRIADNSSNSQFFEAQNTIGEKSFSTNKLWLSLHSDNNAFNQTMIGYVEGATDKFDGFSYDAPRNLSSTNPTVIYSMIESDNRQFAIQGKDINSLSKDEVIPIGFKTAIDVATIYTLSIPRLEGNFMNQNDIFIKDNLLNKTHNLKESDYSFTSEVGEFTDRFEIVFTREALSLGENKVDKNTLQIIELPNGDVQFKVSSHFEMKSIEITDLLGRTLYKLDVQGNSQTFSLNNLSQATYLAKVKLSNGKVITKKAIKRK